MEDINIQPEKDPEPTIEEKNEKKIEEKDNSIIEPVPEEKKDDVDEIEGGEGETPKDFTMMPVSVYEFQRIMKELNNPQIGYPKEEKEKRFSLQNL